MKHWTFRCREVSRMVSEFMDRELSWQKRMGIRLHLMMYSCAPVCPCFSSNKSFSMY
jgi:hypothetical protein